jgi:hypothetical protein
MRHLFPLAAVLTTTVPTAAIAGTVTGRISMLTTRASDGLQIVTIQGTLSGRPSCARYDYFMIRDEKSDAGKAQYAMLMAAYLSGKNVRIDGSGTCTRWGDGEDIEAVLYTQ